MGNLLIHSMAEFGEIVFTSLQIAQARHVVEIGSEAGTMTGMLIEYTRIEGGSLASIDLAPSADIQNWFAEVPHARLIRQPSLEVLGDLSADAWLVDGDHNYYTVLHESELMWKRSRADGTPFLAFYHDVGWPWARRDLYYAPERIPREFVQPHTWDRGVTLGEAGTIEGGFRGAGQWACAEREGGPRNGVLTAIEDFVTGKEADLAWACVPAVFGLGILYDRHAPWTEALTRFLVPHHMNPLLESLEKNRLACYLAVIDWQDRHHAA